ncbi:MAG: helix-turn-helix domain-containing protein [Planctomycetes bacterium]|nr:helix-turn-helix domain-containing protein [Planctomycetota bacterium]
MMVASTKSTTDAVAELLDARSVAKFCGCSARTVRRLADAGQMPRPVKLGSLVRWRRAELVAWINAGCPTQQPAGRRS